MIGIFDEALLRFFSRIPWRGGSLPVVQASADKAYGSINRWWNDNHPNGGNREDRSAVPLPFASFWRTRLAPLVDEMSPARLPVVYKDEAAGIGMAAQSPQWVTAEVTVDFWCRNIMDADYLNMRLMQLFQNPIAQLSVNWNDDRWSQPPYQDLSFMRYWGEQTVDLEYQSLTDNTDLEFGENVVESRFTFSGKLTATVPRGLVAHPLANKLVLSVDASGVPAANAEDDSESMDNIQVEEV